MPQTRRKGDMRLRVHAHTRIILGREKRGEHRHLLSLDARDLFLHSPVGADDVLNRLETAHPEGQGKGLSRLSRSTGRES